MDKHRRHTDAPNSMSLSPGRVRELACLISTEYVGSNPTPATSLGQQQVLGNELTFQMGVSPIESQEVWVGSESITRRSEDRSFQGKSLNLAHQILACSTIGSLQRSVKP